MKPIVLLTPTGRTGTTLAMSLLSRHSEIVIEDSYPFEFFIAQLRHFPHLLSFDHSIMNYPFTTDANEKRSCLINLEKEATRGDYYYNWLARRQYKHQSFYMEKCCGLIPSRDLKIAFPNAKFIISVRDPRDVLVSIRAFDALRKFRGFAEQDGDKIEDVVQKIGDNFDEMMRSYDTLESHVLKYEDLINERQKALSGVTSFLGIADLEDNMPTRFSCHETAITDVLSVGRWRSEMNEVTQEICTTKWRPQLEYFQYPT